MDLCIITINYNNAPGLKKTLESIRKQKDRRFQYIVVDGGSTDGSVDLLKEYEDVIDKWVSESDRGIYNAMNKGVGMASGEYSLFLNSGDFLHDENVTARINEIESGEDILFGRVLNFWPDGKTKIYIPRDEMTLLWIIRTGIHHAGSLIRTELMRKYPYDERYKICSDRKFFVQTLVNDNLPFRNLDFIITDFEMGGISTAQKRLLVKEFNDILDEMYPPRLVADYRKTEERIQDMSALLVNCRHKIVGLICGLDVLLIKFFKLILGNKLYVRRSLPQNNAEETSGDETITK